MLFDAIGRFALGQASAASTTIVLPVAAGSFALAGSAALFNTSQPSSAGAYALSGVSGGFQVSTVAAATSYSLSVVSASFRIAEATAVGSNAVTGVTASFSEGEVAQAGTYALSVQAPLPLVAGLTPAVGGFGVVGAIESFVQTPAGLDALGRLAIGQMSNVTPTFGVAIAINMPVAGTAYAITPGPLNALLRTGADFDLVYGGIGHYLEEIERQKQLAKITRKTPAPIVQPGWRALPPAPNAPLASAAPAIDLRAIAAQRIAGLQAQARQAAILQRRRRDIEILLLAS